MERVHNLIERAKPYIYSVFIAVSFGGFNIVSKVSLDRGMSQYVLVAYSFGFGTLTVAILALLFERKNQSKLSLPICVNIFFLGSLCALARVLYYVGLEDTSPTFAAAISNLTPSITFILALLCRMETVDIFECSGRAKIAGTLISLGGATLMTLYKGLTLISVHSAQIQRQYTTKVPLYRNLLKGSIIFVIQNVSISSFFILQTMTIRKYPAPLRLTSLMSLASTLIATIAAVIVDHRASRWRLSWDITLLAPLYTGIIYFGISTYVLTLVVRIRGPVFTTAFQPLTLVVVAIMSLPIFGEPLHLGGVIGAMLIIIGMYIILWGKEEDKRQKLKETSLCEQHNSERG